MTGEDCNKTLSCRLIQQEIVMCNNPVRSETFVCIHNWVSLYLTVMF
jgi:hypothetical protein